MFDPDVEATLLRVYGVDPQEATLRRVWVLLTRLPLGAWQKEQGAASWTQESYLLASVIDAVNQLAWVTVAANSKTKPKPPKPVPRPGQRKQGTGGTKVAWKDLHKTLGMVDGVKVRG